MSKKLMISLGTSVALLATSMSVAGAQTTTDTDCGIAPAGYNVIESNARYIIGTTGKDFICAGDDVNTIRAKGKDDIIYAGGGNDIIFGGFGHDKIWGGEGNDTIHAGGRADEVNADEGDDTLNGNADDDTLTGNKGLDVPSLFGSLGIMDEDGDMWAIEIDPS